jgi:hypothetical protein
MSVVLQKWSLNVNLTNGNLLFSAPYIILLPTLEYMWELGQVISEVFYMWAILRRRFAEMCLSLT